jgi:hypothetical protein
VYFAHNVSLKLTVPVNAIRIQKMMQAMGVPPNGQVAIAVAQRGVLQNPGGATGNLGGAAAAAATIARRGLGRGEFRKEVARQIQAATPQAGAQAGTPQAGPQVGTPQASPQVGTPQAGVQTGTQAGTPTINNNNPVAVKLLLAPTFTPIQANAVLDQTNMRIAIPVRQIDGEFILTMQKMNGVQAIQPAAGQGQTPTAVEGQAPKAETSARPAEGDARPAESSTTAEVGKLPGASNSTEPATREPAKKPELESAKKSERRQESNKDKYGNEKPPQGAIIMTMKMIDDMAAAVTWGGQAAITEIMSQYVKAQTGNGLESIGNNATEKGTAKIVV